MRFLLATLPLVTLAAPAAAQAPYRAVGTEPFWKLTIDARTMRLEEMGKRPVVVPRPPATGGPGGEKFVARGLTVDTTRAHCSDGMSDRVYRDLVIVEIGGRTLRGCGEGPTGAQLAAMAKQLPAAPVAKPTPPPKPAAVAARPAPPVARPAAPPVRQPVTAPPLPPPPPVSNAPLTLGNTRPLLANTRWTVWKIRDREVKTAQPLTVNFSGNQIEGQVCNRFRASYVLAGERLTGSGLAATRRACQGPEAAAQVAVFTQLRWPTRAVISKWGTLTLGNGRDTVMLRPAR